MLTYLLCPYLYSCPSTSLSLFLTLLYPSQDLRQLSNQVYLVGLLLQAATPQLPPHSVS